jgi:tRNA-2-methylthio-N6-dimethylallyladenosine synthase
MSTWCSARRRCTACRELLEARRSAARPQVDISFPEIEKFDHLPPAKVEGRSAFVSIMEGCSKYCSFCVVPYTRGEEVSRPFDDVLTEVAGLADQGVVEVTLLGQNVNAYRGPHGRSDGRDRRLRAAARVRGRDPRHRAHPLHHQPPQRVHAAADRRLRPVPQAGEPPAPAGAARRDRILAAMKRGYTALEYKSIVRRLRAVRPDISLSTDFIVGFPARPTRTTPRP